MPPATRVLGLQRHARAALRPGLVALAVALLVSPAAAHAELIGVSPAAPLTNEDITFTSGVADATTQSWDFNGDARYDDGTGPVAHWSFATPGSYTVRLYGTNSAGESFVVTRAVVVANRPPSAAFTYSPHVPVEGDTVSLTSVSADPDGPIVAQAWDLDGDGAFDDASGAVASAAFAHAGRYRVGLLVRDREGAAQATTGTIDVHARVAEAITPFPVVRIVGSFGVPGIRIEQLVITAPDGARVEIRCRGRGCPFRRLVRKGRQEIVRVRRFSGRVLRPGAVVQVWVTRPGQIGKYTRLRIRKGKRPTRVDRCLPPGSRRPGAC